MQIPQISLWLVSGEAEAEKLCRFWRAGAGRETSGQLPIRPHPGSIPNKSCLGAVGEEVDRKRKPEFISSIKKCGEIIFNMEDQSGEELNAPDEE